MDRINKYALKENEHFLEQMGLEGHYDNMSTALGKSQADARIAKIYRERTHPSESRKR